MIFLTREQFEENLCNVDTTLVCELSDEDFVSLRYLMHRGHHHPEELISYMIDWCYHSKYFWDRYIKD